MSGESFDNLTYARQSTEAGDHNPGVLSAFVNGFGHAYEQPLDGLAQIKGQHRQDVFNVDPEAKGAVGVAQQAGSLIGNASMFIGAAALTKRLPVVGDIAPLVTGAALGFITPTKAENNDVLHRSLNAVVGAGTVGALSFGPNILRSVGLPQTAAGKFGGMLLTNALVGGINTQAESLINNGQAASLGDTASGALVWAGTGAAFHLAGSALSSRGAKSGQGQTAENVAPAEKAVTTASPLRTATAGDHVIGVASEGTIRRYDLHLPTGYDGSKPIPLVVVLDGIVPAKQGIGNMAFESQMNPLADRDHIAVAYPYAQANRKIPLAGEVMAWNSEKTGLTRALPGYDDVNFLDKVISDVGRRANIDPSRVYGMGFSEGGMLLNTYQTRRPGVLAGFASVNGTMNGMERVPLDPAGKPIPTNVLAILGTGDMMLPPKGGRGLMTALLPETKMSQPLLQAQFWSKVNDSKPAVIKTEGRVTQTDWLSGDGEHRVRQIVVDKGPHAWAGSPAAGLPLVGRPLPASVLDATTESWNFLKNARLVRTFASTQPEAVTARSASA